MKKYTMLALTGMLVLAMNVNVFAAGSPKTTIDVMQTVVVDGSEVKAEVIVNNSKDETIIKKDAVDTTAKNAAEAAVNSGIVTKENNTKVVGTLVGAVVDVQMNGEITPSAEKPVTLTFTITGIKANDVIIAAHQKHDGTWEYLRTTTGEGTVSVQFTSLSPVAFIKVTTEEIAEQETTEEAEAEEQETEEQDDVNSSSTSPKTGDNSAVLLGIVAACVTGVCICAKRVSKLDL